MDNHTPIFIIIIFLVVFLYLHNTEHYGIELKVVSFYFI